jgi:hypothetical protein
MIVRRTERDEHYSHAADDVMRTQLVRNQPQGRESLRTDGEKWKIRQDIPRIRDAGDLARVGESMVRRILRNRIERESACDRRDRKGDDREKLSIRLRHDDPPATQE